MNVLIFNIIFCISYLNFLGGFGGAQALAIALAIKAKIVLVLVLLAASFVYYTRVSSVHKGSNCAHRHPQHDGVVIPIEHSYVVLNKYIRNN